MEVDQAEDDDVFFADLSKQIALLIMDEEEEEEEEEEEMLESVLDRQGFVQYSPPQFLLLHQLQQQQQQQQEFLFSPVPAQLMVPLLPPYAMEMPFLRESSKGTGVFIPRCFSAPAKRKNKLNMSRVNRSTGANSTCNKDLLRRSNKSKCRKPPN